MNCELYRVAILQQLIGKGWVYKSAIKCDISGQRLEEIFDELSALHLIHLGVGNLLLSTQGESYLKTILPNLADYSSANFIRYKAF